MTGPVADTSYGKLQGTESNGIHIWRGIPFAAPPVGGLRFRAPQPPEPWSSVREAKEFGPVSHQPPSTGNTRFGSVSPEYSEDCLYLNVWSPAEAGEALPVMVWIHGGTFVTGAGSQPMFEGSEMARTGRVVVVTVNYRLGPFGFMHMSPLGDGMVSNAGLLDQIAALEWVQANIAAFGGDPSKVTLFGESAGSMSIAALLTMPAAKGLFARAIMQSGAAQTLPARKGDEIAAALLAELGIGSGGDMSQLSTLPAEQILKAAAAIVYKLSGDALSMLFQPVVEPSTLPAEPAQAILEGAASGIPLIIGTNLHEGDLFFRGGGSVSGESFAQSLHSLELLMGVDNLAELAAHYPQTSEGQADLLTDLYFWYSSISLAERQHRYAPVWMYRFDWTIPGHPMLGKAVHGAEICYIFGNLSHMAHFGVSVTPAMVNLSNAMMTAWTAFAHHGIPTVPGLSWPEYTPEERATLIFEQDIRIVSDPDHEKRKRLLTAQNQQV